MGKQEKWGKMGENGGKWGEMGKNGGNRLKQGARNKEEHMQQHHVTFTTFDLQVRAKETIADCHCNAASLLHGASHTSSGAAAHP